MAELLEAVEYLLESGGVLFGPGQKSWIFPAEAVTNLRDVLELTKRALSAQEGE